jgi:hypothetical protein
MRNVSQDIWSLGPPVREAGIPNTRSLRAVLYCCCVMVNIKWLSTFMLLSGRTMVQADSLLTLAKETWSRTQTTLCGICNGQVATGQVFLWVRIVLSMLHTHMSVFHSSAIDTVMMTSSLNKTLVAVSLFCGSAFEIHIVVRWSSHPPAVTVSFTDCSQLSWSHSLAFHTNVFIPSPHSC